MYAYTYIHTYTDPRAPNEREDYWTHTLKTKAPMGLNVEGGYWVSILHSFCTTISFSEFARLILGLFSVYSDYGYIYFIVSFEAVLVLFCLLWWELFMVMISNTNSATIAMDSSLLGVQNLPLTIIILVDYYFCWLLLLLLITVSIISYITCMGITVTINDQFI